MVWVDGCMCVFFIGLYVCMFVWVDIQIDRRGKNEKVMLGLVLFQCSLLISFLKDVVKIVLERIMEKKNEEKRKKEKGLEVGRYERKGVIRKQEVYSWLVGWLDGWLVLLVQFGKGKSIFLGNVEQV